ncbi:succinylglutamate desuccinylase [Striga asiatica]|uniref:Succinylglutamate desuccinylase n=1 Tax=Striga asiatica TaxID=4170 RepID=A0A5A7Q3E8_STRAF|nr:succinylglutamate desuccinylase [Striga asiatica]
MGRLWSHSRYHPGYLRSGEKYAADEVDFFGGREEILAVSEDGYGIWGAREDDFSEKGFGFLLEILLREIVGHFEKVSHAVEGGHVRGRELDSEAVAEFRSELKHVGARWGVRIG